MKATSIRLGFATNSSSSHSILLTNVPPSFPNDYTSDYEYGWEQFIFTEQDDKLRYLATMVHMHLSRILPKKQAALVVRDLFRDVIDIDHETLQEGYIDHQSVSPFPEGMNGEQLNDYVSKLIDIFSDPALTIVGGNDNGGDPLEYTPFSGERIDLGNCVLNIRRDGAGIVFFNSSTGAKVRFHPSGVYLKAVTPELVDIKITDYCPYGCEFCYQGSTKKGKDTNAIPRYRILVALKDLNVFEIALGGGEPTESQDFVEWINDARRYGIVPNFTTYSVKWLKDEEKVKAAKRCGGIGVSVHKLKDIEKVNRIRAVVHEGWRGGARVTAQHVFGILSVDDTLELIEALWRNNIPVLLLGYKTTGFGGGFTPYDMTDFAAKLHTLREKMKAEPREWFACTLSADTAFVEANAGFLKEFDIPEELASSPEGKFSCYIDAVEGTIAPSSYGDQKKAHSLQNVGDLVNEITEAFAHY